ncbi:DUF2934 domain-containing protein [Pseudomonas sp. NA-150]|uniref:DUF2934 domain-containing protein n=1 Tax=Pseudomonas sp. NA-150 TaxID=3367525 RepID=UPI0037C5A759
MDEQKIREAAYQLWEKQGKPQGQDLEHWFTAEKSAGDEDPATSTSEPSSSSERPDLSGEDSNAGAEDQNKDGR